MKNKLLIIMMIALLLAACTPAEEPPDYAATEASIHGMLAGVSTFEANVAATQRAVIILQESLATDQAELAAQQAALEDAQAAITTAQTDLSAERTTFEEQQAALEVAQNALATQEAAVADQSEALTAEAEELAAIAVALEADRVTINEERAALDEAMQAASAQAEPTEEPVDPPADDLDAAMAALGVQFTTPDGWEPSVGGEPELSRPAISFEDDNNLIGLARGSLAELSTALPEETEVADTTAYLQAMIDAFKAESDAITGGRIRPVAINAIEGIWSQLDAGDVKVRFYMLEVGTDDYLFIAAVGAADTFNNLVQGDLGTLLQSLEVQADDVALGLNFAIPEGWTLEPGDEHNVRIVAPEGISQEIALSRGMAEEFDLPDDLRDPVEAMQIVAEAVNAELELGSSIRVEPFEMASMYGAFTTLRNDDIMARLYLLPIGEEWLLIMANAPRDDFNTFNRTELREVIGSLEVVSGDTTIVITEPIGPVQEGEVEHISDGDTIYVILDGVVESVRIIGIDTPEAHHPDSGVAWYGYEATHAMEEYVQPGSTVWLESDLQDRDDFDRLLRYVWVKDDAGNWINVEAELIRRGFARVRTYDEDRYVAYFTAMQDLAQEDGVGVWGTPPPPPPVESIAERNDPVWAVNPDGDFVPLLYDAAAMGNVYDPVAVWPNNIGAVVRDVWYIYDTDIDPQTGETVSEAKVGYWYWLEINDFRGWVHESWLLLEEPENAVTAPDTDIIAYMEPFIVSDDAVELLTEAGAGDVVGSFEPETRVQVKRLGYDPATDTWWLWADTQTIDGWIALANLNRLSPEYR